MPTIAVLGTLDTKGAEHRFVADRIRERGHEVLLIDVGTGGPPTVVADVGREQVAAAGELDLAALSERGDRGEAVTAMAKAAAVLLPRLYAEGRIGGVISLGGGGGTAIGTAAMRALPIGVPKLMVSTLAAGDTAAYVGTKDVVMMPSVVDVAGLNRVTELVLTRAAGAICGMVESVPPGSSGRPLIVASMFGNTTDCVNIAREVLEAAGYEVLVFHATGAGGRAMEDLIDSGLVAGVLDVTTTELADELVGGVLTAGPDRLNAAARRGVPTIVAPGCLDMVNFGEPAGIPPRFTDRRFYQHNPQVTLMRTTPKECRALGELVASKLDAYRGPVTLMLPTRAISVIAAEGQPFHDPAADAALFEALRTTTVEVVEIDTEINDPEFARRCAERLLEMLETESID